VRSALIEAHYLPSLAYFQALQKSDIILLEKHEQFVKQSYRNRCYINAAQGKEMLTIPLTAKHGKPLITDVRIDHGQRWLNNQWRTIQTAYGKAPFFEFYSDDLHQVLFKRNDFLYDLNYTVLSLCLKWLRWNKQIRETTAYEKDVADKIDLRNLINVKNLPKSYKYHTSLSYNQVFGNMFVQNLSLIDLIFCTGPQANQFICPSTDE
jgi:hypothetical protein